MYMGKASTKAQNKYIAKAYDRVNLTMPKGKKDAVQAHATQHGESVNAFINRAIDEAMERDGTQEVTE
ncbi:MAG: Arc family DNA-binding protein [Ruminococcaceae bacterium]|nr:Arc family DNA-binding protein [Oscillospiraceae bacterium]